jgi:nitrous oxidase accessory protein NosD
MKLFLLLNLLAATSLVAARPAEIAVTAYPTIQGALDANPGRMIYVPSGDYTIGEKIVIRTDNAGLFGPGRIIQTNSDQPIITIEKAAGVRIRDLTLTRAEGKMESKSEGLRAAECVNLVISGVQVIDNHSPAPTILLQRCTGSQVRDCLVQNYMCVSVDDRMKSKLYGYAFNCIDGTGISSGYSKGMLIQGNRVIENRLLPTVEMKEKFSLGKFVKKAADKPPSISQKVWEEEYVGNWHQGSAIVVTAPEVSDFTQLIGNYIENAAQGMDIHADHVTVAQNIVNNAFIGMKAMHGSRNVIITGNQFSKNDLWAIGLMPGAAAHPAADGKPETENVDGGSIIANNIISDFGHGHAHWMWGDDHSPFKFDTGQEPDDPPLADVLVQGNLVQAIGPPRYEYAIITPRGPDAPRCLHFSNNLLHPGTRGVANIELPQ